MFVGNKLFSSEQGPAVDDEVNLIEKGANYGWSHISGYPDNQSYAHTNFSAHPDCASLGQMIGDTTPSGTPVVKETDYVQPDNYRNPLRTFLRREKGTIYLTPTAKANTAICAGQPPPYPA